MIEALHDNDNYPGQLTDQYCINMMFQNCFLTSVVVPSSPTTIPLLRRLKVSVWYITTSAERYSNYQLIQMVLQ